MDLCAPRNERQIRRSHRNLVIDRNREAKPTFGGILHIGNCHVMRCPAVCWAARFQISACSASSRASSISTPLPDCVFNLDVPQQDLGCANVCDQARCSGVFLSASSDLTDAEIYFAFHTSDLALQAGNTRPSKSFLAVRMTPAPVTPPEAFCSISTSAAPLGCSTL